MKDKGICPNCQNLKVIFYKDLCRKCYDNQVHKKKDYKSIYEGEDETVLNIIDFFVSGCPKKEIAPRVNRTYRYICYVIRKYVREVI